MPQLNLKVRPNLISKDNFRQCRTCRISVPDEIFKAGIVGAAPLEAMPIRPATSKPAQNREQQHQRRAQALHWGGLTFQEERLSIMRRATENIVIWGLEGSERLQDSFYGVAKPHRSPQIFQPAPSFPSCMSCSYHLERNLTGRPNYISTQITTHQHIAKRGPELVPMYSRKTGFVGHL